MKHIVCFSGGHSSAIVAIAACAKYGKENVVLLNHNLSNLEAAPIKVFKQQVADYLGLPITYANIQGISDHNDIPDQFDVCMTAGAITNRSGKALCTERLKTAPFEDYLKKNHPPGSAIIYYGFDKSEGLRIERRIGHLSAMGYNTDFPLAFWESIEVTDTESIGIARPNTYSKFKHANCIGCLKGGILHWYVTYCNNEAAYKKAALLEDTVGFAVNRVRVGGGKRDSVFLSDLEDTFRRMKADGIPDTEHQDAKRFAKNLRDVYGINQEDAAKPCECVI